MPRFGKLLFVALLYKRCIGCKRCIGFGVSFQRKIRRNQLLESYGKNIFPTFTSAAINFCTWKPKLLGLGICNVPNFCQTGFRNFFNYLQVPRKCFSCTPKSYLYPNNWKIPIREGEFKGFLLLSVRGYKGNHTVRYFFKLEAIFEDVKIKIYAKHRILNIIFFLNKNET